MPNLVPEGFLSRGALERALFEHLSALRADGPFDLVRDAEPLAQHVGADCTVRMCALAMEGK
jgi:hypothetical protein